MKRILGAALALGLSHGLGAVGTLIPWATNGGATVSADQVLLLDNGSTEARTAYNPCTININSNFDLTFSVYFGQNEEQCGGDGMAFILQACGTTALGADSGEHAYTGSCANSLAIDFDTFQNVAYGDPAYNSLMIRTGGATASTNASTCGTALIAGPCRPPISALQPIVTDGAYHTVEISWNAATLAMTVAVDGVQSAQWTLPAVYLAGIFGGDSNVYYGWGGSDGGATNFESFSQTSPNPALGCAATPTVVATPTAINAPTNVCGNTPAPTYTALPPSATPSPTPTAYPTLCGAAPALVQSSVVLSGCTLTNPSTAYTVPNNPNQILLVQAESTGPVVSGVALSGTALIQLAGSPLAITGGFVYTYYLANPPVGAGTLSVSASAGCSWNVVATLYDNVNQAGPIGAVHANSGSGNDLMTDTVTTTAGGSLVHDLLAYPNGPFRFSFLTGTPLFPAASSACCDDVFGSYANAGGPGLVTLNYSHTSGAQSWWSEAIELKAAAACGSPTTTPAPTTTPTATVSPSPDATPLPETVITASLTYSADDYFEFWINGNQVAAATVFDAGAPPVTVAVPAADFAPGGSPNFIAAEDLNSVANTVGCAWLLTTHNADGSTSYYSSADAGIALYDDTAGASPPPLNGGNNWYQAGWVDAGGLFNQTPVATTAIAWFLPLNLTNPSSGAPIPVLSSNAPGLQHSLAEKLYFRESALLVPVTPTFTPGGPSKTASPSQTPFYTATPTPTQSPVFSPTPTPTVTPSPACCNDSDTPTVTPTSSPTNTPVPGSPSLTPSQSYTFTVTPTFTATLTFTAGGPTRSPSPTATFSPTPTGAVTPRSCGIPGLADARNLFKGCYGLANTVTYTVASRPDQLLLVRVENGSAGRPQAVLYGGVALTPFRTDPTYSGGSLSTFYLAGPPAGTAPLEIDYLSGGCSWNVVAELYSGVDQNSPLGAAGAATGTSNSFSTSLSTTGPESLVSDFMALSQASTSSVTLGGGQVDLGYSPQDGCCEEIFGDVKSVGRPGAHTLTYHLNKAKQYTDQLVEVKGWGACGSPTPTPPATLPPRADPPPGDIFTYPQPCRGRALHFAYFMRRPGQANLRIFNAAGVALGGLDEHREAGPEVGTLEVSAFANGVFYYQMEIRYDAGDREMLKVGKFLIVRP